MRHNNWLCYVLNYENKIAFVELFQAAIQNNYRNQWKQLLGTKLNMVLTKHIVKSSLRYFVQAF